MAPSVATNPCAPTLTLPLNEMSPPDAVASPFCRSCVIPVPRMHSAQDDLFPGSSLACARAATSIVVRPKIPPRGVGTVKVGSLTRTSSGAVNESKEMQAVEAAWTGSAEGSLQELHCAEVVPMLSDA